MFEVDAVDRLNGDPQAVRSAFGLAPDDVDARDGDVAAEQILLRAHAEVVSLLLLFQDGRRALRRTAACVALVPANSPETRSAGAPAREHPEAEALREEIREHLTEAWTQLRQLEQRIDAIAALLDPRIRNAVDAV